MSTKNRSDSGNPSPSPKVKGKQKPSAEMSVSAKSSTQVVGNQSSTGASATAKLSKEEKKRLKAERRVSNYNIVIYNIIVFSIKATICIIILLWIVDYCGEFWIFHEFTFFCTCHVVAKES